jgi:hypothetical protein
MGAAIRQRWRGLGWEPDARGKNLVVYNRRDTLWGWASRKQGLFSEFFAVLGALAYAEDRGAAEVTVRFDSDLYLDRARGDNWWAYYFAPRMRCVGSPEPDGEIHYNHAWRRYGPHGWNLSWTGQILPPRPPGAPYPIDAGQALRRAAELTARYIRVEPALRARVDAFRQQQFGDAFVVGVHYRGTDKKQLYPYVSPAYGLFEAEIHRILDARAPDRYRLFVATDEIEFLDWAGARFGDHVVWCPSAPRLSATDAQASRGGTHKSARFAPYLKGESAVIDCLLLAACQYLVKNRSSLSDVSLAFNPGLPWTQILGQDDPLYTSSMLT